MNYQDSAPIQPQVVDGTELYEPDPECGMSQNELSVPSPQEFVAMGIDSWIREVTGHNQKPSSLSLEELEKMAVDLRARLIIAKEENAAMEKELEEKRKKAIAAKYKR
jgi:hypothetical protein